MKSDSTSIYSAFEVEAKEQILKARPEKWRTKFQVYIVWLQFGWISTDEISTELDVENIGYS